MLRWPETAQTLRRVERWLFPGECLLCQRPTHGDPEDPLVCGLCRTRWERIPDPLCSRCGQPRELDLECRVCVEWPKALCMVRSAVWLSGSARSLVHHMKYGGWWRTTEAMALVMRTLEPLRCNPVFLPVPLGAARRRVRGYNQCDFLARALARECSGTVLGQILRRVRETPTQTGLSPEARRANTRGAFVSRRVGKRHGNRPLVLVDDVFTTGATLVAAAEALVEAGARTVAAVTFARARRPLDDDVAALYRSTSNRSWGHDS